ncbi:uncharacterized protein BX663DRAFT_487569 [Cokeromyces recurvatus]|uniref:uncharacterized protein n=1 Tax=Cokeromyces recurvatus TaxID=90255 RepID=UPI00221EBAA3|nr:uncharacterized protein BX663DRAFT_487569 [Cokeromyces recurvatus]KAI7901411.1 hypothetical protein BX663DRAFT_487569 [Cokeromyces recurvatus]
MSVREKIDMKMFSMKTPLCDSTWNRCHDLEKRIFNKMSFSCKKVNCTQTFDTKMRLNKHNHDDHTSQVTVYIQNSSYAINKTANGFICPRCNSNSKSTSIFKAHNTMAQ